MGSTALQSGHVWETVVVGMLCGTRKGGDYVEEPGRMALGRLLTAGRERGHFYLHFLSLRWFLSLLAAFLTSEH